MAKKRKKKRHTKKKTEHHPSPRKRSYGAKKMGY